MKRFLLLVLVGIFLITACEDNNQHQSQNQQVVVGSEGAVVATQEGPKWTGQDIDRAHDYFGAHPDKADGAWHTALVIASRYDGENWDGVFVLETGELKITSCSYSYCNDSKLALLLSRGDLIRVELLEESGTQIHEDANVILMRKTAVNFDERIPG